MDCTTFLFTPPATGGGGGAVSISFLGGGAVTFGATARRVKMGNNGIILPDTAATGVIGGGAYPTPAVGGATRGATPLVMVVGGGTAAPNPVPGLGPMVVVGGRTTDKGADMPVGVGVGVGRSGANGAGIPVVGAGGVEV